MIKQEEEEEEYRPQDYICPECEEIFEAGQFWIQCDGCKQWSHGSCVNVEEYEEYYIDKFHCLKCQDCFGPSLSKKMTNTWRNNVYEWPPRPEPQSGSSDFIQALDQKTFPSAERIVHRLRGQQLTLPHLLKKGFDLPILVDVNEGLDMVVPDDRFNEEVVMKQLGKDYMLDVIDSLRQTTLKMPMIRFLKHMNEDFKRRPSVYNCISLELSNTELGNTIKAPSIVQKLSWVNNSWPNCDMKPAVSKYCLMSMKGSYTDFHIDFGGTSVWYHVLRGVKIFYFAKPTEENLKYYGDWMTAPNQSEVFFGECVDECYKLILTKGQTLLIPTGWIHAVYTPQDSVVFGGNFLHSLNISLQLAIYELEKRIKTPNKYQFPFFELTHWYAAPNVLRLLQDNLKEKIPPKHLVNGVKSLIDALRHWLNKSREENNGENRGYSVFAPKGVNCQKIIKDLQRELRKADNILRGEPPVKKRKSFKDLGTYGDFEWNSHPVDGVVDMGDMSEFQVKQEPL